MSLPVFVAFLTGLSAEVILLYDRTRRTWLAAVLVGGAALAGVIALLGGGDVSASLDNPVIGLIFVGVGLFVLFFGVVTPVLLPRVNEQAIVSTHILIVIGVLVAERGALDVRVIGVLTVSLVGAVWLIGRRKTLPPLAKALFYVWYLAALIMLSALNGTFDYFSGDDLSLPDAFLFGGGFIFLALHALFFVRFALMTSTLILPRNRRFIGAVTPHIFSDEQVPWTWAGAFLLAALVMVALNQQLGVFAEQALTGALVIANTQFVFGRLR
ncbi:MAG: hypothetical protein K8S97_07530 [Anaerolineae bacterium]|nr:hypothetical protein [Anaerolineae bacterium]